MMMFDVLERASIAVMLLLLALVFAGCSLPDTGPSLVVEVIDPVSGGVVSIGDTAPRSMLEATTGDPNLCCCRSVGLAENLSTVTIHASVRFEALRTNPGGTEQTIGALVFPDGTEQTIGTLVFLRDLAPGERRPFAADGFLVSCASIERLVLNKVDLRGIAFP